MPHNYANNEDYAFCGILIRVYIVCPIIILGVSQLKWIKIFVLLYQTDLSWELSAKETVCIKYQGLLSVNAKKKRFTDLSSGEILICWICVSKLSKYFSCISHMIRHHISFSIILDFILMGLGAVSRFSAILPKGDNFSDLQTKLILKVRKWYQYLDVF